jgi:hypothetical protein
MPRSVIGPEGAGAGPILWRWWLVAALVSVLAWTGILLLVT